MHAAQPEEPYQMTEAEYLAFEDETEPKHEYSKGQVYAMTGGSVRHAIITANTIIHLGNQLGGGNCTVTSSDVRIYIASRQSYHYPDVTVFCGDPAYVKGRSDTISNPVMLVEVLSPGTALQDRNDKLHEYIQIETLQLYVLIAQDEAKVERFMRHESDDWLYSIASERDGEIALPSLNCVLTLSALYQKVAFDQSSSNTATSTDS
jgi:Uma2 family endonuclease